VPAPTVGLPGLEFRLQNALARARRGLGGAAVIAVECTAPDAERPDPGLLALLQGDALERLRGCLREVDTIARAQNTLFALLEDAEPRVLAAHAADRILHELGMPFQVRGKGLKLLPSVGVAVHPDDGDTAAAVLESARRALREAVRDGGRVFRFRTSPETGRAARRIALERALERAVEREEFRIAYQPQVDTSTGRAVGAEALLRWTDPELGEVPPGEFIPVLESASLIEVIGEWVLRHACADASAWARGGQPLKMSVNVSARQFVLGDIVGVVMAALEESGLPPHLLTLELTEGVMLDSTPEVRTAIDRLRALGVRIAIDDFGTGYASLRYIKHFPMDIIKIDKEFVRGLPLNTENAAITNAIVALAHSLGLAVVVEGVETEAEAEFLRDLRCTVFQGFLHGRPMPAEAFVQWHAARRSQVG
jgi:EAL domain-containing protein (putative c-di-GMP-specific phosphodiesterase class I)